MDTKFKNRDLLIQVLNRCIECCYYRSFMIHIQNMIINKDMTFERALWICIPSYLQDRVYRKISQIYHMNIRVFNMNKLNKKRKEENNEKIQK